MEITDNIHLLAQQLFQLIQQQEMEITINQQTIRYTNTKKRPQDKVWRKTENTVDKIMAKVKLAIETQPKITQYQENFYYFYLGQYVNIQNLYMDKTRRLFNTTILQQLEQFVGKNNLTIQARAIYWLHIGFQDRPEILLNTKMDTVIVNQMGKITNAQFEELQNKITQIILGKKVQELLKNENLELRDLRDLDRVQY
ncbi:hypothetical protein G9A89_019436 [Geosiphon pyriformis]|nr:hypothetical protein G9A89_019436 [Geosiphon pyriformis]